MASCKLTRHLLKCLPGLLLLMGLFGNATAQETPKQVIRQIINTVTKFTDTRAAEKLYLQTDKPNYLTGDTLWFKAYLLEAPYLNAATKSGVMYLELANDSNKVVKRAILPAYNGLTFGNIALDGKEIPAGGYTLRAYTNWMRNTGAEDVFEKHFYLGRATNNSWLVNYQVSSAKIKDKENIGLKMRINQVNMVPVAVREMQLKLTDGKRNLLKSKVDTDVEGLLAVNFDLPEKADSKNLTLTLQDLRKGEGGRIMAVPLSLNRLDQVDLQFMPEGGNLVSGLPARVAYKAVNEDGYGANVSGEVYNDKLQKVAVFTSAHKGIGVFEMLPRAGEIYTARVKLATGAYKDYPLPAVKTSGITLRVNNDFGSDSVEVVLKATADVASRQYPYYLMVHSRGIVCYGALVHFKGITRFVISKKVFPTGLNRFTLIGPDKLTLNERLLFIDHNDNLNISITSNKLMYSQRDSVGLKVKVTDTDGKPVQGSFSLAVTDNGQVKLDSMANTTIINQMFLTANLKGFVEDPGYYYGSGASQKKYTDMDNLLLAQGWAGYNWDDAFLPAKPTLFAAENEFAVTGHVTNMFNKPVANSGVTLLSKKPFLLADTVTNAKGVFTFKGIFPADTAVYFIQAKNKKGKSYNVGIEMDEFIPPVFLPAKRMLTPWYVNIDTAALINVKKQATLKEDLQRITRGTVLKDVIVKGKRIIKESKNLNGPGQADQIIDEAELQKAGRMSLGDLLEKRVKGFGVKWDNSGTRYYAVNTLYVQLIIDGVATEFFRMGSTSQYDHLKYYFDYYDAEEIKGIEVMRGSGYAMKYTSRYLSPYAQYYDYAFIEVTTRSGSGPFMKKAVGTYVYKPVPFNMPVAFYSPKYKVDATPDMTDIRSTIHWAPNVITDKEGNATVSFFTADNPGTYSFILEGTDLQGSLGVKRGQLKVVKGGK